MPESASWLMTLIALACLVALSLVVSIRFNLGAKQSFLPTTLATMLLLYLASLAGLLQPLMLTLLATGLIVGVGLLLNPKWRSRASEISDIGLFLTLIACFYGFVTFWLRDFQFIGYDEFTHWALIAKYLADNHALPEAGSHIVFMQYAPGTALIQYFFSALTNGAEPAALFGHLTLFFACVLFLTSQTKKVVSTLAVIAWSLLATYVLRYDLSFIFVDAMLGALLAAALFSAITTQAERNNGHSSKSIYMLVPIIAYLPLVKHVGLVLALSAVTVVIVNLLIQKWHRKEDQGVIAIVVGIIPNCLLLLTALGLSYFSWKFHYQTLGIPDTYQQVVTIQNAIDFFVSPSDPTHLAVWQTFLKRMSSSVGIATMALVIWSAILVWVTNRQKKLLMTASLSTVAIGFAGYLALLLISYAFFFEGDERIHLASFERYARSYQLGWLLVLIALPTVSGLLAKDLKRPWPAVALLVGCIGLISHPLARSSLFERAHIYSTDHSKRIAIAEIIKEIGTQVPQEAKIFFFDVSGDGLSWYMLRYETAGQRQISTCWSPPSRSPDGSLGPPNEACEKDLQKMLDGFDYLVLFSSNDAFAQLNRHVSGGLSLDAPQIYQITNATDGGLSISPLGNQ